MPLPPSVRFPGFTRPMPDLSHRPARIEWGLPAGIYLVGGVVLLLGGEWGAGAVFLLVGGLAAHGARRNRVRQRSPWRSAVATCKVAAVRKEMARTGSGKGWTFDLCCQVEEGGRPRRFFPRPPENLHFFNARSVEDYLARAIGEDGRCTLWISSDDPESAFLHAPPEGASGRNAP